jgi:hypothetical protein
VRILFTDQNKVPVLCFNGSTIRLMAIQIIAQHRDIVRRKALSFTQQPTLSRRQFAVLLGVTILRSYEFGS